MNLTLKLQGSSKPAAAPFVSTQKSRIRQAPQLEAKKTHAASQVCERPLMAGEKQGRKRKLEEHDASGEMEEVAELVCVPVSKGYGEEIIGRRVRVYWPGCKTWFCGTVTGVVAGSARGTRHTIAYDDGDRKAHALSRMEWEFTSGV